jgi:hypothetical protein
MLGGIMEKIYYIVLILILIINLVMAVVLFKQNLLLNEYKHKISILEVRMEDIDDAIEQDVVPRLQEIINKD